MGSRTQETILNPENSRDESSRRMSDESLSAQAVSKATLILLVLSNIFLGAISSLPGPFFPDVAKGKGLSATYYGLIISASHLSTLIFTPVVLIMAQKIPSKMLLSVGSFTVGGCAILFGTLQWCPEGWAFISLAFAVRFLEGFGASAMKVSIFALLASQPLTSKLLLSAYTSMENLFFSGLALGPSVGAGLLQVQGFYLPFYCFGGLCLITSLCILFALPSHNDIKLGSSIQCSAFKSSRNILYFLAFFVSFFYTGFLESSLTAHLSEMNVSPVIIALLFALPYLAYNLMAAGWRWLLKKGFNSVMFMVVGGLISIASLVLVGPVELKRLKPLVTYTIVALALKGTAESVKIVSAIYGTYGDAISNGSPDNSSTLFLVFQIFTLSTCSGLFVGSSTSGYLHDLIGFRQASLVPLGLEIIIVPLILQYAFQRNYTRTLYMGNSPPENQPILNT